MYVHVQAKEELLYHGASENEGVYNIIVVVMHIRLDAHVCTPYIMVERDQLIFVSVGRPCLAS